MHTNTQLNKEQTDMTVSHVPPLPSSYKVERRGGRRRENSNKFKYFCIWSKKLKRTNAEKKKKENKQTNKTPAGIPPHVTLHSPATVIKGVGFMRRRHHISTCPSCSCCDFTVFFKVQTGALITLQTHPRRHIKLTHNSSPVHLSIKPSSLCVNELGASNPSGHVTDVHLERLQYASHTVNMQYANCK